VPDTDFSLIAAAMGRSLEADFGSIERAEAVAGHE
jgi:hypothetical protein